MQFPTGLTFLDFVGPQGFIDIEIGVNFGTTGNNFPDDIPPSATLFPNQNPLQSGAFQIRSLSLGPGDFNTDAVYDCADVDSLVTAIATGSNDLLFDLTADGVVDTSDLDAWLAEAGLYNTPTGDPYIPGDANLDGDVDVADFGVWNSNKFSSTPEWCSSDFNADGQVDVSDYNIWNSHKFTTVNSPSIVPEPSALALLFLGVGLALSLLRRHRG